MSALSLVLLLLGASVFAVVICRRFNLPPVLGYLLVGSLIGPHAFNLMADVHRAEYLAEFGVVFLMFSIGLEFSLPKLYTMKRIVFGLGLLQVAITMVLTTGLVMLFGVGWQLGIALGGVWAERFSSHWWKLARIGRAFSWHMARTAAGFSNRGLGSHGGRA